MSEFDPSKLSQEFMDEFQKDPEGVFRMLAIEAINRVKEVYEKDLMDAAQTIALATIQCAHHDDLWEDLKQVLLKKEEIYLEKNRERLN